MREIHEGENNDNVMLINNIMW